MSAPARVDASRPAGDASPPSRARGLLITGLKLTIAVALLSYLAAKGHVDAKKIKTALLDPRLIAVALGLGAMNVSSTALRWLFLLRSEGIECSLRLALRLTWIGHFWNVVIPGAVSGDAVKAYYIGRCAPAKREEAWATVFADRLIGMAALVSLSTLATLINLDFMWSRPELRATALTMLGVLLLLGVGGAALALGFGRRTTVADSLRRRLPLVDTLRRAYHAMLRLGRRPGTVALAFTISLLSHVSAVFTMYLIGRAAGADDLSFLQYCVVVPVALFSNAVPITPGGFGVGEFFMAHLFLWSGGREDDGTAIMLVYRLMFYALAMVGAGLYVLHRHDPDVYTGRESQVGPVAGPADGETSAPGSP